MSVALSHQRLWFANYVQSLMSSVAGYAVEPDSDGDFPVHGDTTQAWVRLSPQEPMAVQVFAFAAHGVPMRSAVWKEINEINANDYTVKVAAHAGGYVIVDHMLFAEAVTEDNLRFVISRVVAVADQIGPMLVAVHGGSTPFAATASLPEV